MNFTVIELALKILSYIVMYTIMPISILILIRNYIKNSKSFTEEKKKEILNTSLDIKITNNFKPKSMPKQNNKVFGTNSKENIIESEMLLSREDKVKISKGETDEGDILKILEKHSTY